MNIVGGATGLARHDCRESTVGGPCQREALPGCPGNDQAYRHFLRNAAIFASQFSGPAAQFISKFWSEEDRAKYSDMVGSALLKYVTEKYGEDKPFEPNMMAILAIGRNPVEA